ncbi:MAG: YraN family protein [Proteobacteria bacterium]|nr:YraN family protein [Pseudomonadota bacterium]
MKANTRELGTQGEDKAVQWLLNNDFQIISRNFRKRGFEIDIVAVDKDDVLRFIEVKNVIEGEIMDAAFNAEKRNILRYFTAVESFLMEHPKYRDYKMCMDVMVVCFDEIKRYENVTGGVVV